MTTLNQGAARVGHAHGVTAATDITGFGLLGHLRNIVRGSSLGARIYLDQLPLLADAKDHLAAGVCPAGSKTNRAYVAPLAKWADATPFTAEPVDGSERELRASIACDAQTSGGLLLCVAADRAAACVAELRGLGLPAAQIGELCNGTWIELH